ncbi:hypothetical protein MNBD_PLANCTO03-2008 [hydrothermal vent metagenome]|uniref:Uncharacterized protein n=1 Tax=hydrothermal vent metagenome TaxID=652676 RepID=A0A3B1E8U7_9ZZZZ
MTIMHKSDGIWQLPHLLSSPSLCLGVFPPCSP